MKKHLQFYLLLIILSLQISVFSQVAPYSISPKWVFGDKVMLDFSGGAPTQVTRTDNLVSYEGASTLCDSSGALMVYTNNVRLAGANFTPLTSPNIMTGSSSSAQGGVIIPDPNNIDGGFYVLVGNAESNYVTEPNDIVKNGIKVYRGSKSGTSVTINTTPTNLFTDASLPTENAYVSSNGNYGYRLINYINSNATGNTTITTREVTATGIAGSATSSAVTTPSNYNIQYQSAVKVNRCQNKIAFAMGSILIVANYDRLSGTVGTVICSETVPVGTGLKLYSVEFSPNGNYVFYSTLEKGPLRSLNLTNCTATTLNTNTSGTLQVAPDGNIYLANGIDGAFNTTGIAVITSPNTGGTYSATGVTYSGTKQTKLGLTNQAWINPRRPMASAKLRNGTTNCREYTFGFRFYTHFNDRIALSTTTWQFTDNSTGIVTTKSLSSPFTDSTNHILPTSNAFNVRVSVVDQVCGETWISNTFTVPSCVAPVKLLYLNVKNDNNVNLIEWATIQEENSAYFNVLRSENGVFKKIGSVPSRGNSNSLAKYRFEDQGEFMGNVYYKLEQVDLDGSIESSDIVSIKSDQLKFVISPNPSNNEFYLSFDEENIQSLSIYNLEGRKVEHHDFPTRGMAFGKELTTGTYLVKVAIADQVFVKKILKL